MLCSNGPEFEQGQSKNAATFVGSSFPRENLISFNLSNIFSLFPSTPSCPKSRFRQGI